MSMRVFLVGFMAERVKDGSYAVLFIVCNGGRAEPVFTLSQVKNTFQALRHYRGRLFISHKPTFKMIIQNPICLRHIHGKKWIGMNIYIFQKSHLGMIPYVKFCLRFSQQVDRSPSIEIDIRSHQHVAELAVVGGSDLNFKIWSLGTLHFYPESKLAIFLVLTAYRGRSEEHTCELQSRENLVCRLLLEKK